MIISIIFYFSYFKIIMLSIRVSLFHISKRKIIIWPFTYSLYVHISTLDIISQVTLYPFGSSGWHYQYRLFVHFHWSYFPFMWAKVSPFMKSSMNLTYIFPINWKQIYVVTTCEFSICSKIILWFYKKINLKFFVVFHWSFMELVPLIIGEISHMTKPYHFKIKSGMYL